MLTCGSCTHKPSLLESRIADYWEHHCSAAVRCQIDMTTITPVSWDSMYVFKINASKEDVERAVDIRSFDSFEEMTRKIILRKGKRIVYQEQPWTDPEGLVNGEAVFDLADDQRFKVYDPSQAIFFLKKVSLKKGSYFELKRHGH